MSEEMPRRIIKKVRLNDSPLLYGDKKIEGILAGSVEATGSLVDIRAVERRVGQILEDAQKRAVQIEKDAYERGFRKGVDDAIQRAQAETDKMCRESAEEARRLIQGIHDERERILSAIEPQVIELVIRVARKVIRQQLDAKEKEVVVALARGALKQAANEESVKIKINPADYQAVQENREGLVAEADNIARVEIESDRAVPPGNCVIETSCGTIDAGTEAQMENIEEAFNELIDKNIDGSRKE